MTNCEFGLQEINLGCLNNASGLITIALAPFESVTGYTGTLDELGAYDNITDFLLSGGTGTTAPFLSWQFARNGASFVEEKVGTPDVGGISYTTTLTIRIPRREKAKRAALAVASASFRNLLVLVKDGNSEWNLMGISRGAYLSTSSSTSGAAVEDFAGYDVTIVASGEPNQMPFVSAVAAAANIAS
jgi:hypothetical protein